MDSHDSNPNGPAPISGKQLARAFHSDVHPRESASHAQGCSSSPLSFQIGKESKEMAECTMVLRNVATVFNNRKDVVYGKMNGFIGISSLQSC